MNGELEQAGDRWRLRFVRHLPHPPEKVWRAVTEVEHLAHWFPDRVAGDFTVGSRLRFESGHVEGGFPGEVLAVEPPRLLEFTWGTDTLRFQIKPAGAGCVLTLLDTIDVIGKAARDAAGWHGCLDRLELDLDGVPGDGVDWQALNRSYVAAFGSTAATIGPPEA